MTYRLPWTNFSTQADGMGSIQILASQRGTQSCCAAVICFANSTIGLYLHEKIALFCIWKYEKLAIHMYLHAYLQMRTTFKTTKALESFHTTITYPLSINTKKLNIMMLNFRMIFKYQPPVPFETKTCKSILNTPTV